ncbi:MAG: radical SAM family heme chaperone HemW [Bacteroidota bacterium]|nr:radical SAM family heme chaperone HemW [Bacteroidota bacterium]
MAGIYIHIPFCTRKCAYCDFVSVRPDGLKSPYLDALVREIRLRSEMFAGSLIHTIYFGGGTPSLLEPSELEYIADALVRNYRLSSDIEWTIECNPGTIDAGALRAYRDIGFNRLSIGVQSFFDEDLVFLTRMHDGREALEAIEAASTAGFKNIGIDLMFRIPGQPLERWQANLERAVSLRLPHISCYSLTTESRTPLVQWIESGEVMLPSEEEDAHLYTLAYRFLTGRGYQRYEISNFAQPGFECRHNISYWDHEPYGGFGPSAHSYFEGSRSWNTTDVSEYIRLLAAGTLPSQGSETLSSAALRTEHIFLSLRTRGIDLDAFQKKFDGDFLEENASTIERLMHAGFIEISERFVRLTLRGMLLCDEICSELR